MSVKMSNTAKERAEIELKELDERLTKLDAFIESGKYLSLSQIQQELLLKQRDYMTSYFITLNERIKHWDD